MKKLQYFWLFPAYVSLSMAVYALEHETAMTPAGVIPFTQTPDISITPSSPFDYGDVTVGSTQSQVFTISNVGDADLHVSSVTLTGPNSSQFTITDNGGGSFVVAPYGTEQITVRFNPADYGAMTANISITSDDPDENPLIVGLTGTGLASDISVSPSSPFDYGNVAVGSNASQIFTVSNNGNADLHVSSVTLTGTNSSQFTITDDGGGSFVVAPYGTEQVTVRFNPADYGAMTATLSISSDDPDEPALAVNLTGTGLAPDIHVNPSSPYDYGSVTAGANASQDFTISNFGNANLYVSSVTLSGTDADQFSVTDDAGGSFTVYPTGSETVTVQFNPTSTGTKKAMLQIGNDDPDENPKDILLSGNGIEPSGIETETRLPKEFKLLPGFPNPFNPDITLTFHLAKPAAVILRIVDLSGRQVTFLLKGENFRAGIHEAKWDGYDNEGNPAPSGVYLFLLKADDNIGIQKAILMR